MTLKTKRKKKPSFSSCAFMLGSLFLLALLLKNPRIANEAVASSLKVCAGLLIPSLFPLMVASEIAVECGAVERLTRPFSAPVSRLLGISKNATAPLFLGLVGGYTTAVSGALSLYRGRKISKHDTERVIALSSLPSLSFLTGFVGIGVFNNSTIGWILWIVVIASSIIIGIFTRNSLDSEVQYDTSAKSTNEERTSIASSPSKIIVGAISHSASSMLIICAFVVFFATLIASLRFPLNAISTPNELQSILIGFLEITSGAISLKSINPLSLRATACAFFVGWSGLSVHFQIMSLCEGHILSFKRYFLHKIAQGVTCALLTLVIFIKFNIRA